jgi:hypothetical protein
MLVKNKPIVSMTWTQLAFFKDQATTPLHAEFEEQAKVHGVASWHAQDRIP